MKLLLYVLLTFAPIASMACPLGAKDDHLTIQRVMINFGKYVGQADHIALLGAKYPNETVTDADIQDAITKIGLAMSCAQAVVDNPTGDMLPGKAMFLEGDELKEYVEDFVYFMAEFKDQLAHYQASFQAMLATKAADRKWDPLYEESEKLNDFIDHAHRKTSVNANTKLMSAQVAAFDVQTGSLKQNMKAAEKNLKAIAASINDSSKNEANAALAYDAALYFRATYDQVPENISDLPSSQQAAAMQGYQAEIRKVVEACVNLQKALLAGDTATATQLLKDLSHLKDTGHDEYNH
ncbi:cytochrome b562 [Bdellovibrio sp. NC01]|uniref:cytochrome b562 n=1 Tax=Bdellovibrio sp. NC01 TaxID=2220073 RepID=UPI00115812FD|nr:cytochrome b562 [Bdellovibrio sp. NC01]QDK36697.1 hypothetical protein DOE51_03315 [Bdellovibrio sp. NC01]